MYATVTQSQARPGTAAEVGRLWREQVGAQVRGVLGVRAVHVLGDDATGEGVTVVLWDSQEAVTAYLQSGQRDQILAPFAAVLAATPAPPKGYDLLYSSTGY
jgi:heme-degrading monooxygenase HmoA